MFASFRIVIIASIFSFLTGCSASLGGYLLKQGVTQLKINSKKIPVDKALKDPNIPEEIKSKLEYAQAVKQYAEDSLGLEKSKNYTYYLPFENAYLTYVVTAAQQYSMDQLSWNYPLVGSLPYRGFFELEDAKAEAARLEEKGYDTYIRGVSAYSTLGWFADPLTKPQLEHYTHAALAELIIHELTHTTIYFSGEGDFNETLAEFVAGVGTRGFLIQQYGINNSPLAEWEISHKDEEVWNEFVRDAVKVLTKFYKKNRSSPNKEEIKKKVYAILKDRFRTMYLSRINNRKAYEALLNNKWNNAFLLSQYTYTKDPKLFERLYVMSGSNMPLFLKKIKGIKNRPRKESAYAALRALMDTKK